MVDGARGQHQRGPWPEGRGRVGAGAGGLCAAAQQPAPLYDHHRERGGHAQREHHVLHALVGTLQVEQVVGLDVADLVVVLVAVLAVFAIGVHQGTKLLLMRCGSGYETVWIG